ncbi:MAG: hypothetical protein F6K14_20475 [Symploca sp. SIO2C1]|nr:hypothetical protein [Symploca sp. SIO2C1]
MAKKKKKSKSTPPPEPTPVSQLKDSASVSEGVQTEQVQEGKIPEFATDTLDNPKDAIALEKPPSDAEIKTLPNGTIIIVKAPWGEDALATIEESYSSPEGEQWVSYKPLEPPPDGWSWLKGVMLLELVRIH